MGLKDDTPAKPAGITLPFDNRQGFVEDRCKLGYKSKCGRTEEGEYVEYLAAAASALTGVT